MMNKKTNFLLWSFTVLVVCFFTLPRLIQHGCFMDGELYAAIAHNLANGIGNFWKPSFNQYVHPYFDQQPPLTFFIQSLWFKLFGSSMYVERLYDFIFCLIHVFLIHLIWKEIFKNSELKKMSWLPILLWISIPVCSWDFVNNMEEITMGVFVQLAILCSIKVVMSEKNNYYFAVLSGISLMAAWMCKGFPGLFPLSLFFWAFVFLKSFSLKNAIIGYILLLSTLVGLIGLLYFNPASNNSLGLYLNNRVLNSIQNVVETDSRFYIVGRLLSELLISIILCTIILVIQKTKKQLIKAEFNLSFLFFTLGLCGVLPIMVTLEQRGFYMTTALPCFAIGFSILIANTLHDWIVKFETTITKSLQTISIAACIILIGTLFFSYNKFARNEESLNDIYKFGNIIPQKSTLGVAPDLYEDWGTGCYFQRFYFIEVDGNNANWNSHPFVMINKASANNYVSFLNNYSKLNLETKLFDLYQHK